MKAAELQQADWPVEATARLDEALNRQGNHVRQRMGQMAQFLAVVAQLGLIALLVQYWQLESQSLARLMWLALIGFIIHHFLPLRFRLPFFALLSVLATIMVIGQIGPKTLAGWLTGRLSLANFLYHLVPGLTLVGIGLALIGLCHIPVRFWLRVAMVAVAGCRD